RRSHVQDHLFAVQILQVRLRGNPARRLWNLDLLSCEHYFLGSIGPGPNALPCASLMSRRRSRRAFVSKASVSGIRTRGSRAIVSLPPAMVTNGPPTIGVVSVNATSGNSLGRPASGKSLRNGK